MSDHDRAMIIRFNTIGPDFVLFDKESVKGGEVVYYRAGRIGSPDDVVARAPLEVDENGRVCTTRCYDISRGGNARAEQGERG